MNEPINDNEEIETGSYYAIERGARVVPILDIQIPIKDRDTCQHIGISYNHIIDRRLTPGKTDDYEIKIVTVQDIIITIKGNFIDKLYREGLMREKLVWIRQAKSDAPDEEGEPKPTKIKVEG